MKKNFISVVIPTYNRVSFLKEAIDSVLSQTYRNFELIVVDDGSTDGTPKLLSSYGYKIRVIPQANQGPSAARNRGIEAAKGKWIAFLDSDDVWKPDKLKKQVQFITDHPDTKICQAEEVWIRNGKRVNPRKKHEMHSGWIYEQCLPLCIVSPSSVMIHRDVFEKVGFFDETMPACEDYDLWLRICAHYPVLYVDENLIVKYGGHSDQLSKRYWGMDRYRIKSLLNLLEAGQLSSKQGRAVIEQLKKIINIYLTGLRKRNKTNEVAYYESLLSGFLSSGVV